MSNATRATQALDRAGVRYELRRYAYDPDAPRIGLHAAESLGEPPSIVLKTLMALVDGKPVCAVIPSDAEVSMKKLAAAFGGKSAEMMRPEMAEKTTGYHVGGISPLGQKRTVPIAVEAAAARARHVYVNGGQRGLQIRIVPADLLRALAAKAAPLVA